MTNKEVISDQTETKQDDTINQLMKDLEYKNEIILSNAGIILRQSKQIDDLTKTLDYTNRQYEALEKKYRRVRNVK